MPTITLKVTDSFGRKIKTAARKNGENVSTMARRALEREVSGGPDFAALASKFKGMISGGADLSQREGYGR